MNYLMFHFVKYASISKVVSNVSTGVFVETRHIHEMQVAYLYVELKRGLWDHGSGDDSNVTESTVADGYYSAVHGKLNFYSLSVNALAETVNETLIPKYIGWWYHPRGKKILKGNW